jgi:hypothetical protein
MTQRFVVDEKKGGLYIITIVRGRNYEHGGQRSRPTKGQNRPNKMGQIELEVLTNYFLHERYRAYVMVYGDGNSF